MSAGSVVTSKDPADMSVFASVRGLEELKLKSSGGSLAVTNLDLGLDTMLNNSRDSLVKLSLVSLKDLGVKHIDVIANFPNLEVSRCLFCLLSEQTYEGENRYFLKIFRA